MTNSKFIDVPQEVDEWIGRLSEEEMIPMACRAIEYAIGRLGQPYWRVLSLVIDLCCQGRKGILPEDAPLSEEILLQITEELTSANEQQTLPEPVSIASYGVFLSNDAVRVRKVLSAVDKASLTEAEGETYDNDFKIAYYPGEYSGRTVEAPDRDMAIYTAGLLDGIDQAEIQQDARDYELAGYPHDDIEDQ